MIEEENERRNDAIDLVVDGFDEVVEYIDPDTGLEKTQVVRNPKIAWWKGHIVNQPFGRYALHLERLEGLADIAHLFMYEDRAKEVKRQIKLLVAPYKRSIDAKSSEIFKDKDHTQSSLIHILSRNKVERQYKIEGDGKGKGFLQSFIGRKDED